MASKKELESALRLVDSAIDKLLGNADHDHQFVEEIRKLRAANALVQIGLVGWEQIEEIHRRVYHYGLSSKVRS